MVTLEMDNCERKVTTKMKLVSIVVPTYRRENELRIALESLAKQTHDHIEIILVDDNGDPEWNKRVFSVVEKFCDNFPGLKLKMVVNDSNQGSAKSRNVGISIANGDYVTFLDDDDVYLPDKVRKQVDFMEDGHFDYSITDLILYNENNKKVDIRTRTYIKDVSASSLRTYHLKYHMTGTDVIMFRRDYLNRIGGFPPIDMGDEFYLMHRAIDGGGKFGYLPGCDVKAYVHTGEGGLSSGDGKIQGENALYGFKKSHFSKIDAKTCRYIRMRHYAVLAYAELRRKRFLAFTINAIKSFISAPMQCISLAAGRVQSAQIKKLSKYK